MRTMICAALLGVMLISVSSVGQTVSGTLSGTVLDQSGAVIADAAVRAKDEATGAVRETKTNAEGFYTFAFMPLGSYEVTLSIPGFQQIVKSGVTVDLNKTTVSDFHVKPSSVTESVQVTGEVPMIETTQGDLKYGLTQKQIEDTPLAGRNFLSLVEQIPGFQNAPWIGSSNNPTNSTGSYSVFNGTGSRSTTFQIDGVNNDDSSENQNRQNVNISTIQEFQVLTNSYTAEFGRAGGAVILVQTKSGTNQFHGEGYDFLQNENFNANSFFGNQQGRPRPAVDRHQYGWTVGGPIIKDKLFFFHSGERVRNLVANSVTRFIWLPSDTPRPCAAGEVAKPGGPYCLDPATHPNMDRDIAFMKNVMSLWNTPELKDKAPNDPAACADMIATGRPNRCVTVDGIVSTYPDSDYTGKIDWMGPLNTPVAVRYQYSRQIRQSGRLIAGDNFGSNNNRQYNIGLTATHVFSPRQTGEFRFGFGNRATLQDVSDGNNIPTIRFGSTLYTADYPGTIIGTSTNVPINRRQHDTQFVYNHTIVMNKHTLRTGVDQRFLLLDDVSGDRSRGYWTFSTLDSLASIRALQGFTGWENFLRGYVTGFQNGYGNPLAENRYNETNLYFMDDYRIARNLTLNLGIRWEGVGAPHEAKNRFDYGFGGDYNNVEPRFGFAWRPGVENAFIRKLTGDPGAFVIRGGYGIFHNRIFQSVFSQNQLSIRTQPPNGYASDFSGLCRFEISDPSCGFVFTPGTAARSTAVLANGVAIKGGELQSTLLIPDKNLHMPYVQQWNLTLGRDLPHNMAVEISYSGNRGIGNLFYDSMNDARYPMISPLVSADVGGGNFQPVVFDRVCQDFNDPICRTVDANGNLTVNSSGTLKTFSALTSTTATLAQKGIVIENGVPHGYISLGTPRTNERRPDPNYIRNVALRNFGWSYYHGMILKVMKRSTHGLWFTGSWTFSKSIDTGSEATFTGVDTNAPTGKGNAARSLRALSSFDARHRVVISYGYQLPWYRAQHGIVGRIAGGWQITGVTMFQSGTPYTVLLGYDMNLDGLGSDRPMITDPAYLYRSVDNGRAIYPCPTNVGSAPCPDTLSQLQIPGSAFIPQAAGTINADQRILLPGTDGTGSIGRNTFFTQGLNNTDATFQKTFDVTERVRLNVRFEMYNLTNRVTFDVPARTVLSGIPMGRITATRNVNGYVNAGRSGGSRMGQLAFRIFF